MLNCSFSKSHSRRAKQAPRSCQRPSTCLPEFFPSQTPLGNFGQLSSCPTSSRTTQCNPITIREGIFSVSHTCKNDHQQSVGEKLEPFPQHQRHLKSTCSADRPKTRSRNPDPFRRQAIAAQPASRSWVLSGVLVISSQESWKF
jgi:hypothetical protein